MQIFSKKVNRLLVDLEKSSGQFWNIPREVAQMLYFLVRIKQPEKIMEIGTSNGYSAIWMAKALADNERDFGVKGKLYTIESHQERFELAGKNLLEAELSSWVSQILGHAPEVFTNSPEISEGQFDLLFFDATKKQHLDFLKGGMPLLKEGGLIVADNVLSHWEEMQHFVRHADQLDELNGDLMRIGDGVYLGVKRTGSAKTK